MIDGSDEEMAVDGPKVKDDEEEFTPARRRATEMPQTPRTTARARRAKTGEDVAPMETFTADVEGNATGSPTKRKSPSKRNSTVPNRRSRQPAADAKALQSFMPSAPVITEELKAPLSDITAAANNEQPSCKSLPSKAPRLSRPTDAMLEKPMDIVIRSRALAAPETVEDTGPKARTVIKSLVLMNFKSYAGRQEVGPFHASFSSVVGPNGSGKSNVIDSLLFVFGFRASKMRQGKISALIHNSAAFPNLDFCEVEVHFQEVMDLVSTQQISR